MRSEKFTPVSESEFNTNLNLFRGADLSNPEFVMYAVICGGHGKRELERIGKSQFLRLVSVVKRRFDNVISNLLPTYGAIVQIMEPSSIDFVVDNYLSYSIGELYYFNQKYEDEFLNSRRFAFESIITNDVENFWNDITSIVLKFYIEDGFTENAAVRYLRLRCTDY